MSAESINTLIFLLFQSMNEWSSFLSSNKNKINVTTSELDGFSNRTTILLMII